MARYRRESGQAPTGLGFRVRQILRFARPVNTRRLIVSFNGKKVVLPSNEVEAREIIAARLPVTA